MDDNTGTGADGAVRAPDFKPSFIHAGGNGNNLPQVPQKPNQTVGMTPYTVYRPEHQASVLQALSGRRLVVDVETVDLDPSRGRLRMVQLAASPEHTWIFLDHWDVVRHILLSAEILIGHNITGFDLLWLDQYGILNLEEANGKVLDTMHLAHYQDNRTNRSTYIDNWGYEQESGVRYVGHGLKDLAVEHLGVGADRAEQQLHEAHHLPRNTRSAAWALAWSQINDDDPWLLQYAADDCAHVWRLLPQLRPRPGETALLRDEARVALIAARMQRRGYRVDVQQLERARKKLTDELDELRDVLNVNGVADLDDRGQILNYLLAQGVPLTKRTTSGDSYALDKRTLEILAKHHPAAELVHRARRLHRFLRDYIPKIAGNRGSDGRIHPSINTMGAATGRWTVTGAVPLHQMPKNGGLRECFVAEPGRVLISCDYSSIEFHVLGVVTGDSSMQEVSWSGNDPYLATARIIYPDVDWNSLTREALLAQRNAAKPFNLGLGYGMGSATLAEITGLTIQEATLRRTLLQERWSGPSRFMQEVEREFNRGVRRVSNLFGRMYTFPVRSDGTVLPHVVVNGLTQGAARDLMHADLLRVVDAGFDIWLTLHDEIIIQVPEGQAEEARAAIEEIMNHRRHPVLGIPIRATATILGNAWRKA